MIPDELVKVNKNVTRLRYEYEEYGTEESREVLDVLQFHLFLVITYFNNPEVNAAEVKQRLIKKLAGGLG